MRFNAINREVAKEVLHLPHSTYYRRERERLRVSATVDPGLYYLKHSKKDKTEILCDYGKINIPTMNQWFLYFVPYIFQPPMEMIFHLNRFKLRIN